MYRMPFCIKITIFFQFLVFSMPKRYEQSHRTDWGLRAFAVAGPSCWNGLHVKLRDLSVGPETFVKHLKTHLFRVVFF